jgi:hypothetical protein
MTPYRKQYKETKTTCFGVSALLFPDDGIMVSTLTFAYVLPFSKHFLPN